MSPKPTAKTATLTEADKQAEELLIKEKAGKSRPIWFKAKLYGWGWYPATWQGWLITLADTAAFVLIGVVGFQASATWRDQLFFVWIPWIGLLSCTMAIAYQFGERPHWQWGKKK